MSMSAHESHYTAVGMVLYLRTWQSVVIVTRAMGLYIALALAAATFIRHQFAPGFETLLVALTYAGVVIFGYWWIRSLDEETEYTKAVLATLVEAAPETPGHLRVIPGTTLPKGSWRTTGVELLFVLALATLFAVWIVAALVYVLFEPNTATIATLFILLGVVWSIERGCRAAGRHVSRKRVAQAIASQTTSGRGTID